MVGDADYYAGPEHPDSRLAEGPEARAGEASGAIGCLEFLPVGAHDGRSGGDGVVCFFQGGSCLAMVPGDRTACHRFAGDGCHRGDWFADFPGFA